MNSIELSRRRWIQTIPALAIPILTNSCAIGPSLPDELSTDIDKKSHWAQRQEWRGKEKVRGVIKQGERYILAKFRNGGWDFPGGVVDPDEHGNKSKNNEDLIRAVNDYVHTQSLMRIYPSNTTLFAYGYAIMPSAVENVLVHWFAMAVPSSLPSKPHASLEDTTEAKWVGPGDPRLGKCLNQRIQEYQQAGTGRSFIKESCYPFRM